MSTLAGQRSISDDVQLVKQRKMEFYSKPGTLCQARYENGNGVWDNSLICIYLEC